MNALKRSLITFAAFLVTYYLVVKVHQDVNGINQIQHTVVWMVFITMALVSLIQWEISWLFGSFVYVYAAMTAIKVGAAPECYVSLALALVMTLMLLDLNPLKWMKTDGLGRAWKSLAGLFKGLKQRGVVKKIQNLAGVRKGGEILNDEEVGEFLQVDADIKKSLAFFDGSDPLLETALKPSFYLILNLQKDHSRLLLRASHLRSLLSGESRGTLDKEIAAISEAVSLSSDQVEKAQLQATIDQKRTRLSEIEKLEICLKRVNAHRLQIIDAVQGTFHQLNGLKYSDIQTLEASRDAIAGSIRLVRTEIDAMQKGLLYVGSLETR